MGCAYHIFFSISRLLCWRGNIGNEDWIPLPKNIKVGESLLKVTWQRRSVVMWWVIGKHDF